ncbi:hypothetical protein RIF29_39489 [Crotalaria pallida]|uniref:AP2/ERF domain-containing protein n=1 Tax=Crotalaria pallida TaxID=3830 RepID=A0AAN9HPN2_CROPI
MSNNRSLDLESSLPDHQLTPQLRTLLSLSSNCILYSLKDDEFYVSSSISVTSSSISSILDAAIDDKRIQECLGRTEMVAFDVQRQHYATHGFERMNTKTSSYRGVIKVNDNRFEAFVWDSTTILKGSKGKTGAFSDEVEAGKAYDLVSIKLYGVNTFTNFPALITSSVSIVRISLGLNYI